MSAAELPVSQGVPENAFHLSDETVRGLSFAGFYRREPEAVEAAILTSLQQLPHEMTLTQVYAIYRQVRDYVDEYPPARLKPGQGAAHARAAMELLWAESHGNGDTTTAHNVCRALDITHTWRARRLSRRLSRDMLGHTLTIVPPATLQTV